MAKGGEKRVGEKPKTINPQKERKSRPERGAHSNFRGRRGKKKRDRVPGGKKEEVPVANQPRGKKTQEKHAGDKMFKKVWGEKRGSSRKKTCLWGKTLPVGRKGKEPGKKKTTKKD